MAVKAKFSVQSVKDYGSYRSVELVPVYSSDKATPNYTWSQATPSGKIEMSITNPDAYSQFAPGKVFYIDFVADLETIRAVV